MDDNRLWKGYPGVPGIRPHRSSAEGGGGGGGEDLNKSNHPHMPAAALGPSSSEESLLDITEDDGEARRITQKKTKGPKKGKFARFSRNLQYCVIYHAICDFLILIG